MRKTNSRYFIPRGLSRGPCATVAVVLGRVSAPNLLHSTTELVCLCDLYFIATMQFLLERGKNTSHEVENGNDKLLDNSCTQLDYRVPIEDAEGFVAKKIEDNAVEKTDCQQWQRRNDGEE